MYLRDAHYQGAKKMDHGKGYLYPHSFSGSYISQQYMPDELKGTYYYHPSEQGFEKEINERLKNMRKIRDIDKK